MNKRKTQIETGSITQACRSSWGKIQLPYRHYYREEPNRMTCFFLGGGPGMSNLQFIPPEEWLDRVDVAVLEYRGVGQSQPKLASPHFRKALRKPIAHLSLAGSSQVAGELGKGFEDLKRQGGSL